MSIRRKIAAGAATALAATTAIVVAPTTVDAGIVDVSCTGDDSVLQGELKANGTVVEAFPNPFGGTIDTTTSQGILDLLGVMADPPAEPPTVIDAQVQVTPSPSSFAPGTQDISFLVTTILPASLTEGLVDMGINEIDIANSQVTIEAGQGVTGPALVVNPPDQKVIVADGIPTAGPFTQSYDVTGANGSEVTFNLTQAQLGFSLAGNIEAAPGVVVPFEVQAGVQCTPSGNPVAAGLVVDPNGPVTPGVELVTVEGQSVSADLNEYVADGPAAPNDPSSLELVTQPNDGTATLGTDGVVTYAPNAGFVGNDSFQYRICTQQFVTVEGQDQIDELTVAMPQGIFALTVDGTTTGNLDFDISAANLQAELETIVGAGNVTVTGGPGDSTGSSPYVITWTGELSETAVTVSVDSDPGGATLAQTQAARAEETDRICNSGLISVTVDAAADGGNNNNGGGGGTTTTTTTAPANPAAAATTGPGGAGAGTGADGQAQAADAVSANPRRLTG